MEKIVFNTETFSGVKALNLLETKFSKEIRICMEKGSVMQRHIAPDFIMVQILKGKIEFSLDDDTIILDELDMISLDAKIPHSLKALENSIIRLTLSKSDEFARVLSVPTA